MKILFLVKYLCHIAPGKGRAFMCEYAAANVRRLQTRVCTKYYGKVEVMGRDNRRWRWADRSSSPASFHPPPLNSARWGPVKSFTHLFLPCHMHNLKYKGSLGDTSSTFFSSFVVVKVNDRASVKDNTFYINFIENIQLYVKLRFIKYFMVKD